jgi:hypothetical protein
MYKRLGIPVVRMYSADSPYLLLVTANGGRRLTMASGTGTVVVRSEPKRYSENQYVRLRNVVLAAMGTGCSRNKSGCIHP